MEASIDELAELARREIQPAQFLGSVVVHLKQVTEATVVRLWSPSPTGSWIASGQVPSDPALASGSSPNTNDISWLTETASLKEISTRIVNTGPDGDTRKTVRTLCPIIHSGQTVGLFDLTHELDRDRDLSPDIHPFHKAMGEVTADFLSQSELRQLRQSRSQWQQWEQFILSLMKSTDVKGLAATIVNDGRLLTQCDRVTLLRRSGSHFVTLAVTGVEQVEPRSNTVRSLSTLASIAASDHQAIWFDAAMADTETAPSVRAAIADHITLTGAKAIGLIPLPANPSTPESAMTDGRPVAPVTVPVVTVLALEQFQNVANFPAWRSRAEQLAHRSEPLLLAAIDRESIPFYHTLQRWRHPFGWLQRSRVRWTMLSIAAAALFLIFVPAEFTVTGVAELVPDHRREVFASSSGIVDQLKVQHGDDVEVDQPLIVLRDPQLDLELPRIIGEIEVVSERLKGILAVRLSGGSTVDSGNRTRQLTSEELELKERQRTLERQRQLVEEQKTALTLKSPIRGKVLTWDVSTLLSARPVERGQALLTIGDTNGPWVVEMRVADKDFGHVRRAQKRLKPNLDVDFLLASDPSRSYRGTIRDVAESTHLDDQLGVSVMVTVAIDPTAIPNQRAGTTAIPRIRCGQQPIGYVWLHELFDVIRTRLLF